MAGAVAPLRAVLFTTATTGTSLPQYCGELDALTVYVTGFGTISTGTLVIEEADYEFGTGPFAGTWSEVQSIDLTAVSGGGTDGIQQAVHIPTAVPGDYAYGWIRGRITDDVTGAGGSVTVVLRGH